MTECLLEQEWYGDERLGDRMITQLRDAGVIVTVNMHYPNEPDEYFVNCETADDILNISRITEDAVQIEWDGSFCTPVLTVMNGWRREEVRL